MSLDFIISVLLLITAVTTSSIFESTVHVNQGETFTLPCKNQTDGKFYGIVWKTTALPHKSNLYSYMLDSGYNIEDTIQGRSRLVRDTYLRIMKARPSDTGLYECNLIYYTSRGTLRARLMSNINVIVFVAPRIIALSPAQQLKSIGGNASITCIITANPNASIIWRRKDGKQINGKIITQNFRSVLRLEWLRSTDTATYICAAKNKAGEVEKSVFLKVKAPPKIVFLAQNTDMNIDTNGKLTCRAVGYPSPSIDWLIFSANGKKLTLKSGQSYDDAKYSVSETKVDYKAESSHNSLQIKSVTTNDWENNYTCVAANSEGSVIKLVKIVGYDKPGSPTLISITIFTHKSIIQWKGPSQDGGSKVLAYIIEYKNATQKHWTSREIRPANVDRYQITDLKPDTVYTFRIFARNSVGISQPSEEFMGKTTHISSTTNPMTSSGHSNNDSIRASKPKSKDDGFGITALIGVCAGVFLLLIVVFVVVFFLFRKVQKTAKSQTASVFGSRPVSMENGSLAPPDSRRPSEMPSMAGEDFIPLLSRADQWEFPRDRLRLSTILGTGAFGMVMRGDAQGIRGSIGTVKCAVKMAKDTDNEYAKKDLYAELDMLKLLPEHPNVVSLLGCCTRSEPLMIIVEYCAHGDLQGLLRNSRGISEKYYSATYGCATSKLTSTTLLKFAWEVAKGMNHLAAFKVIHRDLAARNILVDENMVCKINDFGFARDIYVEDQYQKKSQGGRFPIKWMAIESLLDNISTTKSDVWSFGVVLWEIVTLGASPYPGMSSYEVVSFLQDGYRMEKPKHCSDELYAVLMDCWHNAPTRRPIFENLAERLEQMVHSDEKEFINMNFYQDHLYENFDVNLASQSSNAASAQELTMTDSVPLVTTST